MIEDCLTRFGLVFPRTLHLMHTYLVSNIISVFGNITYYYIFNKNGPVSPDSMIPFQLPL